MTKGVKISSDKSKAILTLRFGSSDAKNIDKKLMGYSAISRVTNVSYSTVRCHCLKFEKNCNSEQPKAG